MLQDTSDLEEVGKYQVPSMTAQDGEEGTMRVPSSASASCCNYEHTPNTQWIKTMVIYSCSYIYRTSRDHLIQVELRIVWLEVAGWAQV